MKTAVADGRQQSSFILSFRRRAVKRAEGLPPDIQTDETSDDDDDVAGEDETAGNLPKGMPYGLPSHLDPETTTEHQESPVHRGTSDKGGPEEEIENHRCESQVPAELGHPPTDYWIPCEIC